VIHSVYLSSRQTGNAGLLAPCAAGASQALHTRDDEMNRAETTLWTGSKDQLGSQLTLTVEILAGTNGAKDGAAAWALIMDAPHRTCMAPSIFAAEFVLTVLQTR